MCLHIDAAYGGSQLTDRGRARLPGMERADSIMLDAHKGLFMRSVPAACSSATKTRRAKRRQVPTRTTYRTSRSNGCRTSPT
jgi:glutamate/tyrosine decarboxylase-like PLP-dependent enzyme